MCVLADRTVGGEDAALGGVHDGKARKLALVGDAVIETLLAVGVGAVVGDEHVRVSAVEQLTDKVKELKSELFKLRFQLATGQLQNTMQITAVKRDIARAKTVLRLKEQA